MGDLRHTVRQLDILRTLQARRYGATTAELASLYATTQRTIQRDLRDLREAGFFLDSERRGDGCTYYQLQTRDLPPLNFPLFEVAGLLFVESLAEVLQGTPFRDDLHQTVHRILSALPEGQAGGLYLIARVPRHGQPITLAVERIQGLEPAQRQFAIPASLAATVDERLRHSFGIISGEPFSVQVRFSADQAPYIRERIWHPSQQVEDQADGSLILSFHASSPYEIRAWVLQHGAAAQVLSPAWLRDEVQAQLQAALDSYRQTPSAPRRPDRHVRVHHGVAAIRVPGPNGALLRRGQRLPPPNVRHAGAQDAVLCPAAAPGPPAMEVPVVGVPSRLSGGREGVPATRALAMHGPLRTALPGSPHVNRLPHNRDRPAWPVVVDLAEEGGKGRLDAALRFLARPWRETCGPVSEPVQPVLGEKPDALGLGHVLLLIDVAAAAHRALLAAVLAALERNCPSWRGSAGLVYRDLCSVAVVAGTDLACERVHYICWLSAGIVVERQHAREFGHIRSNPEAVASHTRELVADPGLLGAPIPLPEYLTRISRRRPPDLLLCLSPRQLLDEMTEVQLRQLGRRCVWIGGTDTAPAAQPSCASVPAP